MWKRLSYDIFGNCLPGEKEFTLVFTKPAKKVRLGIYKKTIKLNDVSLYFCSKRYYSEENLT